MIRMQMMAVEMMVMIMKVMCDDDGAQKHGNKINMVTTFTFVLVMHA